MNKNKVFMLIALSLTFSSRMGFGMKGEQVGETEQSIAEWMYDKTGFKSVVDFSRKHQNKIVLAALMAPVMYRVMGRYGKDFRTYRQSNSLLDSATNTLNPPLSASMIGYLQRRYHDPRYPSPFVVTVHHAPKTAFAAAILGTSMYLSRSQQYWLNLPEVASEKELDKKIQILKERQQNMSYARWLMGGAIGLDATISMLETLKKEQQGEQVTQ